jgi:hydroxymethylglutaryl-CoA lyase
MHAVTSSKVLIDSTCRFRSTLSQLTWQALSKGKIGKRRLSLPTSNASRGIFTRLPAPSVGSAFISESNIRSYSSSIPSSVVDVKIVEVGPRDGLQNEVHPISVEQKLQLIRRLQHAGIRNLEVGAFVSPQWVPQMANSDQILKELAKEQKFNKKTKVKYSVLVPNRKGLESALHYHEVIDEIAIFAAASEAFSQRNINSTIQESMHRFQDVIRHLQEFNSSTRSDQTPIRVRGYVSTVIACPYQGSISPAQVARVVEQLLDLGCYEISLGDTIGVGTPGTVKNMLKQVVGVATPNQLAMHFHDTYGQALANILAGMEHFEIYTVDSSVAGLGGCPYAKGASGNVATEDVVYMLEGMGISTGIDLQSLVDAGMYVCQALGDRPNGSKVSLAFKGKAVAS